MVAKKHHQKLPSAILPFAAGKTMLCRRLFQSMPSGAFFQNNDIDKEEGGRASNQRLEIICICDK